MTMVRASKGNNSNNNNGLSITTISLILNAFLGVILLYVTYSRQQQQQFAIEKKGEHYDVHGNVVKWNGGHPLEERPGSCWCSGDDTNSYCMCTPSLAIDLIILSGTPNSSTEAAAAEGDDDDDEYDEYDQQIWVVKRKDTGQYATMGGFVNVGETTVQAVKRELMEEMGIDISNDNDKHHGEIILFGVYSDPRRDNRRTITSIIYAVQLDGTEQPVASSDVKDVKRISLTEVQKYDFFDDHKTILMDYKHSIQYQRSQNKQKRDDTNTIVQQQIPPPPPDYHNSDWDFAPDIVRSVCSLS